MQTEALSNFMRRESAQFIAHISNKTVLMKPCYCSISKPNSIPCYPARVPYSILVRLDIRFSLFCERSEREIGKLSKFDEAQITALLLLIV